MKYLLVATEQKNYFELAESGKIDITGLMLHGTGYDELPNFFSNKDWIDSILEVGGKPMHLHLVSSDRKIKLGDAKIDGDYCYNSKYHKIFRMIGDITDFDWKIVASSDESMDLLPINTELVKHFLKHQRNDTVMIDDRFSIHVSDIGVHLMEHINKEPDTSADSEVLHQIKMMAAFELKDAVRDNRTIFDVLFQQRKSIARQLLRNEVDRSQGISMINEINDKISISLVLKSIDE